MKLKYLLIFVFASTFLTRCQSPEKEPAKGADFQIEKVIVDSDDPYFGHYQLVIPKSTDIKGLMVLLPGFGQKSEDIFLDTDLHKIAYKNQIATLGFSGLTKLTADTLVRTKLSAVLTHVVEKLELDKSQVFIGGFSAGGNIALRYAELCHQFPEKYPVLPKAVFMADSPVDLFHSWNLKLEDMKNNRSEISVKEGQFMERFYRQFYGATPSEDPERFRDLSPFAIDSTYGTNERFLKDVAVRAYHDIDVSWRIKNRNQTARFDNYIATSELINRLNLMGNDKAEFIQTYQTGFRRNGERHPHSWSIIDAEECVEWLVGLME